MQILKSNPNRRRFKELEVGTLFIFDADYLIKIGRLQTKVNSSTDPSYQVDAVCLEDGNVRGIDDNAFVTVLPNATLLPYGEKK